MSKTITRLDRGRIADFSALFDEHLQWFAEQVAQVRDAKDRAAAVAGWLATFGNGRTQFLIVVEFWAYAVHEPALRNAICLLAAAQLRCLGPYRPGV